MSSTRRGRDTKKSRKENERQLSQKAKNEGSK